MSCALAQRFAPGTPFFHRLIIGYDVTDELFGITIARPGYLNPFYTYGAIALAAPAWASGTALGIIAGNLLPLRAVSALSVALYGMFSPSSFLRPGKIRSWPRWWPSALR